MLKRNSDQIQLAVRILDLVVAVFAFLLAYYLRTRLPVFENRGFESIENVMWILAFSMGIHILIYPWCGFYESIRMKTVPQIILMVLKAMIIELFLFGGLVFLAQLKETSRALFAMFIFWNAALILVSRLGARVLLWQIRVRGYNYRQVLIVGTGSYAEKLVDVLQSHRHWGYMAVGYAREPGNGATEGPKGLPVVGDLSDLESIVKARAIDEVYFASDRLLAQDVGNSVALCEKLGIMARFSMDIFGLSNSKVALTVVDGVPLVTFYTVFLTPFQGFLKRTLDVVVAICGLAVTGLFYPWIRHRIQKESPGPIIFKQVRVGENGRLFKCYKFRTMVLNAEDLKQGLMQQNEMQGPMFKVKEDPRIFPFGIFLRKTSLDELPQFLNILRGEMSVVGTRPPTPDEVIRYETHFRRRLSMRPGLTGMWQVSGRNKIQSFEDVLQLDLKYIDQWSIWLDLKIILKTIWVIFARRGAY